MRGGFPKYLQCPYCQPFMKGGKKVPKTVGKYRVMQINDIMLMLRCEKCRRVMKIKYFGYILTEDDITPADIKKFNELAKKEAKK